MTTSDVVRERLQSVRQPSSSAHKVLTLLEEKAAKAVSKAPATVTVSEALRLWRTRLENTKFTKAKIQGVEDLLTHLEKLAPQRQVDQFGFIGTQAAITVFFTRNDGNYVGSAILDKRKQKLAKS
jgi:hypothetical protein